MSVTPIVLSGSAPPDQMHTASLGEESGGNSKWTLSLNLHEMLGAQGSPDLTLHPRLSLGYDRLPSLFPVGT